ncbi:hypothetical protein L6R50_08105 [Myxococcota bacterium]|nr:hypothetical protein [Myxococcota bacterium]
MILPADLAPRKPTLPLLLLALLAAAGATGLPPDARAADEDGDEEHLDDDAGPARTGAQAPASRAEQPAPPRRPGTTQRVLFVDFVPANQAAKDDAAALSAEVLADLRGHTELDVLELTQVPPIFETPATLYMKGCPDEQEAGCQLVLGEKGDADRVVSGRVELRQKKPRLIVTIINIAESQVEQAYAVEVEGDGRASVVRSVATTLARLAAPPVDEVDTEDLRGSPDEDDEAEAQLAREKVALKALDSALGNATFEVLDVNKKLTRPARIRMSDLDVSDAGEFISTPWEDIGLNKREYIAYRNSGLALDEWRRRHAGHHLQLLLGVSGGVSMPFASNFGLRYYGHYIQDDLLSHILDNYGYQSLDASGARPRADFTVGFGILPFLDFEYTLGIVEVPVYRQKEDGHLASGSTIDADPSYFLEDEWLTDELPTLSHAFKLRFYPLREQRVRPSIAVGYGVMPYPDIAANELAVAPNSKYLLFPQYTLQFLDIEPGVMFELGQNFGAFVHFPIWIDLTASDVRTQEREEGSNVGLLDTAFQAEFGLQTGKEPMPNPGRVSFFVEFGIQFRPNPVFVPKGRRGGGGPDEILGD